MKQLATPVGSPILRKARLARMVYITLGLLIRPAKLFIMSAPRVLRDHT